MRRLICDELTAVLATHRCLLAPTVADYDVPLAEVEAQLPVDSYAHDIMTVGVSLAGLPAIVLRNGVQLIGRRGDEEFLFEKAKQIIEQI